MGIMKKDEADAVRQVEELRKMLHLFQIQGFKTPEEMFVVGYLAAHGGERLFMDLADRDMQLLKHDSEFWLPIVEDDMRIRRHVHEIDVERAKTLLKQLLQERNAKIPKWLQ